MASTQTAENNAHVYTPEEAAKIIGPTVTAAWLRRKAGRKEIPCQRLGKIGFTQKHIDAIIAKFDSPARSSSRRR